MVAGTLTRLKGGRLRFEYQDDYRSREVATPLSLSMPRLVREHSDAAIRPWLWGLLPDNPKESPQPWADCCVGVQSAHGCGDSCPITQRCLISGRESP